VAAGLGRGPGGGRRQRRQSGVPQKRPAQQKVAVRNGTVRKRTRAGVAGAGRFLSSAPVCGEVVVLNAAASASGLIVLIPQTDRSAAIDAMQAFDLMHETGTIQDLHELALRLDESPRLQHV
jgi:hypothetical protein